MITSYPIHIHSCYPLYPQYRGEITLFHQCHPSSAPPPLHLRVHLPGSPRRLWRPERMDVACSWESHLKIILWEIFPAMSQSDGRYSPHIYPYMKGHTFKNTCFALRWEILPMFCPIFPSYTWSNGSIFRPPNWWKKESVNLPDLACDFNGDIELGSNMYGIPPTLPLNIFFL